MSKSRRLTFACSAALLAAWTTQGFAQQNAGAQQNTERTPAQQTQSQSSEKSASQRVSDKAGQPTNVMIVGTVTDARNVELASTAGDQHRLLKVKPKGGEEIIVDIGVPRAQTSQTSFAKGDRIVAVGKPARINNRPVVFAANVGELQQVGRTSEDMSKQATSKNKQATSSTGSGAKSASSKQQSSTQRTAAANGGYDAVIHLFTTDNLVQDRYGPYDEDFAWETNDSWYDSWNDTADSWDQTELGHYDLFGYDDSGEAGLWDW